LITAKYELLGIDVFPIHALQIRKGGIKSQKEAENNKYLKKGLAQDELSAKTSIGAKQGRGVITANTGTCVKRAKHAKREHACPSPLQ